MSVIPLICDGPRPTVVSSVPDFERAGGVNGTAVLIRSLEVPQLIGDASNVSYDLRVGQEYRDHRDVGKTDLPDAGVIVLHPGAAVIIETEESVHVPSSMFGCIVPKVGLLQQGLSNTLSKIDPGYDGHLLVTLFNLGQERVELRRRQWFCSVCFLQVLPGARLYSRPEKRIQGMAQGTAIRVARDWINRNVALLAAALIVVNLLILATGFARSLWRMIFSG